MKFKVFLSAFAFIFAIALSSFTVNDYTTIGFYNNPAIPGVQSTPTDCEGDGDICQIQVGQQSFTLYKTPALLPGDELREIVE